MIDLVCPHCRAPLDEPDIRRLAASVNGRRNGKKGKMLITKVVKPAEFTAVKLAELVIERFGLTMAHLDSETRLRKIDAAQAILDRLVAEGILA